MRILVIEDEQRIANTIKEGLTQEHYLVDVAYDGESGFDLASEDTYELIILDLMLPKMDGMAICHNLRKEKIHTPILMLTARGQTKEKIKGLNTGADDYLVKPFDFEELLARIRALTRRPNKVSSLQLQVGNLTLNPQLFTVTRDNIKIELTHKEFALLEFLMRHAGQIISKEQIIQQVWEYDSDILPNTVEAYIKNIRKKVDQPFNIPLIKTVHGFGYRLEKQ